MRLAGLAALLLALAAGASAQPCPISYNTNHNLLMGGVLNNGVQCTTASGQPCQRAAGYWWVPGGRCCKPSRPRLDCHCLLSIEEHMRHQLGRQGRSEAGGHRPLPRTPAPALGRTNRPNPPAGCYSCSGCRPRCTPSGQPALPHYVQLTSPPRRAFKSRAEECKFPTSSDGFGVCNEEQRAAGLKIAEQLHGGDAMRTTPCDLFPYIRGRTLWLIG
jgi:hypothetical protein